MEPTLLIRLSHPPACSYWCTGAKTRLDYVLALKIEDFLERRLQTQVLKNGLAKSICHARVLVRQRHIRVGKQMVNVPSLVVCLDSQKGRVNA